MAGRRNIAVFLALVGCIGSFVKADIISGDFDEVVDNRHVKKLSMGKKLELKCNVSIEGNYELEWTKDGQLLPVGEHFQAGGKDEIFVNKAEERDVGEYTCQVKNAGIEGVDLSFTVLVYMEPSVRIQAKSINLVQGETLIVACNAWGHPSPTVVWYRGSAGNDTVSHQTDSRVNITTKMENDFPVSTLSINNMELEDRNDYVCVASNEFGNSTTTVYVRVKDKLAALWPFLGICAEVAVLCAIIFIYEKRRNKGEIDESDTDASPEKNTATDHGKESDVRHRK